MDGAVGEGECGRLALLHVFAEVWVLERCPDCVEVSPAAVVVQWR